MRYFILAIIIFCFLAGSASPDPDKSDPVPYPIEKIQVIYDNGMGYLILRVKDEYADSSNLRSGLAGDEPGISSEERQTTKERARKERTRFGKWIEHWIALSPQNKGICHFTPAIGGSYVVNSKKLPAEFLVHYFYSWEDSKPEKAAVNASPNQPPLPVEKIEVIRDNGMGMLIGRVKGEHYPNLSSYVEYDDWLTSGLSLWLNHFQKMHPERVVWRPTPNTDEGHLPEEAHRIPAEFVLYYELRPEYYRN